MRRSGWRRLAPAALLMLTGALVAATGSPSAAAVPDRFGFVLWNGAVVASGTTPAGTGVVPLALGRYQVKFPGQAITGGVVHVTAINSTPHWCQVESWSPVGPDEIVVVRCYKVGGVLDNSAFSAIFFESSGPGPFGPYGYVDGAAAGGTITQYNSSGGVNVNTHLGVGSWDVKFPGIGSAGPNDGSLQLTAVNAAVGTHCSVATWTSNPAVQDARVLCFTAAGAPFDTRFTLTFQLKQSLYGPAFPPKYFGYLWWAPGPGPLTTNFNSQVGLGANTPATAGTGLVMVKFPQLAQLPDDVQVTAFGGAPNFCGMSSAWSHIAPDTIVRDVNCFTVNGTAVNNGFLISDNSLQ